MGGVEGWTMETHNLRDSIHDAAWGVGCKYRTIDTASIPTAWIKSPFSLRFSAQSKSWVRYADAVVSTSLNSHGRAPSAVVPARTTAFLEEIEIEGKLFPARVREETQTH